VAAGRLPSGRVGEDRLREAVLTGSAGERRPVTGCRCPSCLDAGAERAGVPRPGAALRAPSGLLVPGVLSVDGEGGETGAGGGRVEAAGAGGVGFARGAGLPDDNHRRDRPPLALATSQRPGARVLGPGERLESGGVRVIALPAGTPDGRPDPRRVALVLGCGERTLLWAPDGGPLPPETLAALADARLSAAVLNARTPVPGVAVGGPGADADAADGLGLAHQVARLRRVRALAPQARVIAAGLSHEGPTPARYAERARPWGIRLLPDGARLWPDSAPARDTARRDHVERDHVERDHVERDHVEPDLVEESGPPRRTVVLGAAASGKSLLAESLLAAEPEVVYVATGPQPDGSDPGWAQRVAAHRLRRPDWWQTLEGGDPAELLARPGPPLLLDSLGTWVAAELSAAGAWDDGEGRDDEDGWRGRLQPRLDALVAAWRQAVRPVVAVVEEVGWGVVPATAAGGRFRDVLGTLSRRITEQSERVLLVVAGRALDLDRPAGGRDGLPGSADGWPGAARREGWS
jgi:adenosylcobinamide kinase/adenosylcobinamide-phosphate guanylyltransferase